MGTYAAAAPCGEVVAGTRCLALAAVTELLYCLMFYASELPIVVKSFRTQWTKETFSGGGGATMRPTI